MSTFTLAISYLTTSNLPWFMDLTFQVLMQPCSLQHWTLLLSPVTSTAGYCFCFGSIPSFFLELFLHWSLVAYWAPTDWGVHLSVSYLFAFSYCSWGSQGKNAEVVCHSLLQWTTFCGQESIRRNEVSIIVNKRVWNAVLGCNLKNDRMISVCFQGKPFNITVIQAYAPTSNAE